MPQLNNKIVELLLAQIVEKLNLHGINEPQYAIDIDNNSVFPAVIDFRRGNGRFKIYIRYNGTFRIRVWKVGEWGNDYEELEPGLKRIFELFGVKNHVTIE